MAGSEIATKMRKTEDDRQAVGQNRLPFRSLYSQGGNLERPN
jgi:hypothetical protein